MEENQSLVKKILQIPSVRQFLEENKFDEQVVQENLLTFCSYQMKLGKCKNCKGLEVCQQSMRGYTPSLYYNESQIVLDYLPCSYQQQLMDEIEKKQRLETIATNLEQYNLNDIYNNLERKQVLLKVKSICSDYANHKSCKGLYIYGPYGCGKSYILAWLAKKLADMKANVIFAYYPDLVRQIKSSIWEGTLEDYLESLKNVEVLMLDDIGGESNSDFIRDEVLGAILQTRMNNQSLTFMSSNLDSKLLLEHLASGSKDVDRVKGTRIFERIQTLMEFVELKDQNYRK